MPKIYNLSINMKIVSFFLSKHFHFLVVKFSLYLNRHVFVMDFGASRRLSFVIVAVSVHCLLYLWHFMQIIFQFA